MPYIGRPLNAGNLAVQSGTGDGSDTTPIATLDYSVGSSNSIGVYLDGVRQLAGTDFTASGTVLTFTTAPANGVGVDVYFLGLELSIPTPADATVTTAKIAANAVDETKLKDALVADFTEVVVTASDSILLGDATDSGNTKRDTVQGLLDLVPAAGLSLLSSVTISSDATVSFTGGFGGAHHHHVFIGSALIPATDSGTLTMVLSTDGGSSYASSGYEWLKHVVRDDTAVAAEVSASDSHLELTFNTAFGNAGAENWNFWIHMWFPEGTGATHYAGHGAGIESSGKSQLDQIGGSLTTAADTDAVRFLAESGAIASGKIDHYAWTD